MSHTALSYGPIAVDPTGAVGVLGSATLRQLYAVDLRGLETLDPNGFDPNLQRATCNGASASVVDGVACLPERVIRGVSNPIAIPPAAGLSGTDGFIPQVRFDPSGRFVAATAYNDGLLAVVPFDLRNLEAPHPLLASRFGTAEVAAIAAPIGTPAAEFGPGPLILLPTGASDPNDPIVLASEVAVWLTGAPDGTAERGAVSGTFAIPTGDLDADTIEDALDNCPDVPNPSQADADSDGIGDACESVAVPDLGPSAIASAMLLLVLAAMRVRRLCSVDEH